MCQLFITDPATGNSVAASKIDYVGVAQDFGGGNYGYVVAVNGGSGSFAPNLFTTLVDAQASHDALLEKLGAVVYTPLAP